MPKITKYRKVKALTTMFDQTIEDVSNISNETLCSHHTRLTSNTFLIT